MAVVVLAFAAWRFILRIVWNIVLWILYDLVFRKHISKSTLAIHSDYLFGLTFVRHMSHTSGIGHIRDCIQKELN
jgi:hypothetical protein